MERRAKIMATLGPASSDEGTLAELLEAGVDLVRLNLSHGSHEEHGERIERVRRISADQNRHVPIVVDLMGPRYRLGQVPGGKRQLAAGEVVSIGAGGAGGAGEGVDLPVDDPEFLHHLKPGERMLVDSGLIELRVEGKQGARITAKVVNPGEVSTRKGINLPDSDLPFTISEKDRADIAFAREAGADFLAASYVGEAAHVQAIRDVVRQVKGTLPIIAKLERATALEHLGDIVAAADGVMVARGDLGVEVPLATVPVLQKKIVAAGRKAGKPVIVATQMLESMIEQPRPTRAEATDVANAVFDGADALMLSGETAVGKHAVAAVSTMAQIVLEAESYSRHQHPANHRPLLRPLAPLADAEARHAFELEVDPENRPGIDLSPDVPDVVSAAAVYAAGELSVSRLVAWTQSGFTARLAARYRPDAPIVAFTPNALVARQLQLVWGVRPLVVSREVEHLDGVIQTVDRELQRAGLAHPGDRIIVLMGHPIRERPLTNLLRVHRVRSIEEWERTRP